MSHDFCIIGAGKVGSAVAYMLSEAGWEFIGAASRSFESASRACRFVGDGIPADDSVELAHAADLVLITTPDDVIKEVCGRLAENDAFRAGTVVAHCSGALESTVLGPARQNGASVGSLHPLQTFASAEQAVDLLAGSSCCIEGDSAAVKMLRKVADDLGMRPFAIPTEKKALYHAAAVMSCNYFVALESAAMQTARAAGVNEKIALTAFLPLIEGTLRNVRTEGIPGALTGPVARGDVETVRRHLEQIADSVPDLLELYTVLGRETIGVACESGSLSEEKARELRELLAN